MNMGTERGIAHLKAVSEAIKLSLTGAHEAQRVPWVRVYGPTRFPYVLKFLLGKYEDRVLYRLLRLHAFVTLDKFTKSQLEKFFTSAGASPSTEDALLEARELIALGVSSLPSLEQTSKEHGLPLPLLPFARASKFKSERLSQTRKRQLSLQYSVDLVLRSLDYLNSPVWSKLLTNRYVRDAFYPMDKYNIAALSELYSNKLAYAPARASDIVRANGLPRLTPAFIGRLGFTQEPGGKLRVFASPNLVWQASLEPLKRVIQRALADRVDQDVTHDQESGAIQIQEWLNEGNIVWSYDLSDATNLFPFPLQTGAMEHPHVKCDPALLNLYKAVVDGWWEVPDKVVQEYGLPAEIKFTRGQPLGLGPSFFTFAYTHHALVRGIALKYGRPFKYVILGDDVAIADRVLAEHYKRVMLAIGCKISDSKSYISDKMAEFAGFTISGPDRVRPGKFRTLSVDNIVETAKLLNSDLKHEVSPEVASVLRKILSLPKELGGNDAGFEDVSDLVVELDNQRRELEMNTTAGDLLERRCARVLVETGFIERKWEHAMEKPRFSAFLSVINWALENAVITRQQVKEYGIVASLQMIEAYVGASLVDRTITMPVDTKIRLHFGIPLSADLLTARRRLTDKFRAYYSSVAVCDQSMAIMKWLERFQWSETSAMFKK